jgi:hypothetical protein
MRWAKRTHTPGGMLQFQKDVADAKARNSAPAKMKSKQSDIEMAADKALADPAERKALKAAGEKAEIDYDTMLPSAMSLLQEGPEDEADDLGESDVALMGGDDSDVARAINEQINGQVSNQLGQIPTESGDVNVLEQFEQDQQSASAFLMAKQAKQANSDKAAKAKKAMEEAQVAMKASAAAMANMRTELGEGADTQA